MERKRPRTAQKVLRPSEEIEKRTEAMMDVVGVATGEGEAPLAIVCDDGGGRRAVVCIYGVSPSAVRTGDVVSLTMMSVTSETFSWRRSKPLAFPLIRVLHSQVEINEKPIPKSSLAVSVAVLTTSTTS